MIDAHDTEQRLQVIQELTQWLEAKGVTQADALIILASYVSISVAARAKDEPDLNVGLNILMKSMRGEALRALRAKQMHSTQTPTETRQ